ncbi:putative Ulp1 peptidase [Helianthus debilis subsp. tardiflorus]
MKMQIETYSLDSSSLISGRTGYDYNSVRRWTTQRKLGYSLLECDKIFVPVHKEIHWCLVVINKKEENFQYLDSLGGVDKQVMRVLLISGRTGYDYNSVRRWTTQRKLGYSLLECDKIFVPVHKEIHWCLVVINKKEENFQYLDSLGGVDKQVMRVLAKYSVDEVKDKNGEDINVTSWQQEYVTDLPNQENVCVTFCF